jgi:phosphoribosylamine--glycine ligase
MERKITKEVRVGNVSIGGGSRISIQSMTNTDTLDKETTLKQVERLYGAGCDIIRIAIPTVEAADTIAYIKEQGKYPVVVKADGLALGKGVVIATSEAEAVDAVNSIMQDKIFGESGSNIVIEEFLTGPEVSVLSFTDGKTVVPMISSMDHKRALDNDEGLNTGGMGTVAPNPYYTEEIAKECMDKIFIPTINAMKSEGRTFKGCLYFGLMLTPDGPKVIEYNCRFGDPETQVVLPLLDTDLYDIFEAIYDERLSEFRRI